jgi:transposase-like protein
MSGERRGDEERIEGTKDERRGKEEGEKLRCKWCGSPHLIKYGKSHGKRQVYFCKVCERRFVPRPDGFERMREDPDVVALALDLYFSGLSLRKVAKHLREVHYKPVSHVAVYRWAKNFVELISEFVYELRPELCGIWYADEMSLKVRGRWAWLWNVMDRDTRFLLASIVTSERETEDAIKALKQALRQAKERPKVIVTDGLPAYEEAIKKLFWSRYKEKRVVHEKHVRLYGDLTTNLIERLQGTVREGEGAERGQEGGLYDRRGLQNRLQLH